MALKGIASSETVLISHEGARHQGNQIDRVVFLTSARFGNNIFSILGTNMIRKSSKQIKSRDTRTKAESRYAPKDVTDKLGIRSGFAVQVVGKGDTELLVQVRTKAGRAFATRLEPADIILFFPRTANEIGGTLRESKKRIKANGGIWVITAKRDKGEPYVPDHLLIQFGLGAGLVDNKICSVSSTHSAMRFVIRLKDR